MIRFANQGVYTERDKHSLCIEQKMPFNLLSKSKYLTGLQCPRLVWIEVHEPERLPGTDPVTQYVFDQGRLVGDLAKKLYPEGISIPIDDFKENISTTLNLLKQRKPLFEAGVLSGRLYSRLDILKPTDKGQWDIIEVKSSTSVKEIYINDVAFQRYCCSQSGLEVGKCYLALINNQYIKYGEIEPKTFFNIVDITGEVEEASVSIDRKIENVLEVINLRTCPEMIIGPHCKDPYECALTDCWDHLPEHHIFTLYYGGKKAFEMYDRGIMTVSEIPESYRLNNKQQIQKECVCSGKPYIDRESISGFLSTLKYPLYFLDFETFSPAVPLFDGTRPYQDIPFQFSLHSVNDESSKPEHYSFLASSTDDPRPNLLAELKKHLGNSGSIIAYNKGFEEGVLKDLAPTFPEYSEWIETVCGRLVDLLSPFRNFDYYHPNQKGSASLKVVLPAITGRGYGDLNITDGQIASIRFLTAIYGNIPETEKALMLENLEEYCGRDTEGMIWIVEKLRKLGE